MVKAVAYGNIKDGKLTITNRKRLEQDLRQFKNCDIEITIKKKGTRSGQQNRYYWGVVVQEVRLGLLDIGYRMTHDEVHHFLKQKFNSVEIPNKQGEVIEVPGTTTELNTLEFMDYVETISAWASEYLGVVIPMPNQELTLNF